MIFVGRAICCASDDLTIAFRVKMNILLLQITYATGRTSFRDGSSWLNRGLGKARDEGDGEHRPGSGAEVEPGDLD